MSDEDRPDEETFYKRVKASFERGSKAATAVLVSVRVLALVGAYVIGFSAEIQADSAEDKAETRTTSTYETLRQEVEELWLAHEMLVQDMDDAAAEFEVVQDEIDSLGLKVRDIHLEDRLERVESLLKGRRVAAQRPSQDVSAPDEGPPSPEDMLAELEAERRDAERKAKLAEAKAKRARDRAKKSKRDKLPGAKDFFYQQRVQQQMVPQMPPSAD